MAKLRARPRHGRKNAPTYLDPNDNRMLKTLGGPLPLCLCVCVCEGESHQ